MKKLLIVMLMVACIEGCVSTSQVIQDRFDAGRQRQQAEVERRNGNEAKARILEDSARRNENTISLPMVIFEAIFN